VPPAGPAIPGGNDTISKFYWKCQGINIYDSWMTSNLDELQQWIGRDFPPLNRQSEVGPDGHARRGGCLPPVPMDATATFA
jgi:hypothetical protein